MPRSNHTRLSQVAARNVRAIDVVLSKSIFPRTKRALSCPLRKQDLAELSGTPVVAATHTKYLAIQSSYFAFLKRSMLYSQCFSHRSLPLLRSCSSFVSYTPCTYA